MKALIEIRPAVSPDHEDPRIVAYLCIRTISVPVPYPYHISTRYGGIDIHHEPFLDGFAINIDLYQALLTKCRRINKMLQYTL